MGYCCFAIERVSGAESDGEVVARERNERTINSGGSRAGVCTSDRTQPGTLHSRLRAFSNPWP